MRPSDPRVMTEYAWQGRSRGVPQTMALAALIGQHAQAGDLIALIGGLGAGKTQFVRGLAQGLRIAPQRVSSPTFVIVREYEGPAEAPLLVHIDAYRLNSLADLNSIGWELNWVDPYENCSNQRAATTQSTTKDTNDEQAKVSAGLSGAPHGTTEISPNMGIFDNAVVAVEWADRLADFLPNDRLEVCLTHQGTHHRIITLTPYGSWKPRLNDMAAALDLVV